MTTLDDIHAGFVAQGMPAQLATELLEAFAEAKRRFFRADLRPSAVEGGRFSEAAFRILQWATSGTFTALGDKKFNTKSVIDTLEKIPAAACAESLRLHIPRSLRVIYDVRNSRNTAHLGDGIDPNRQDASLVIRNMEWVLAELVRLYHTVSANQAQSIIEELVSKEVPVIQVFDGYPRILKDLAASDYLLVLLYWTGQKAVSYTDLRGWMREPMRRNFLRTVRSLDVKNMVHPANLGRPDATVTITEMGWREVESRGLVEPA